MWPSTWRLSVLKLLAGWGEIWKYRGWKRISVAALLDLRTVQCKLSKSVINTSFSA